MIGTVLHSQKPRAQFCWACGRQLYQRKAFTEMVVDGHPRILHKQCAKSLDKGTFEESCQHCGGSHNDETCEVSK